MQAVSKLSSGMAAPLTLISGMAGKLSRIALFSPADDLLYPLQNLTASLQMGRISVALSSRFLSRVTVKAVREYTFDAGHYPQPEEFATSVAVALKETQCSRSDITLAIPKAWTILKTVEFPSTVKDNLSDVIMYEMDRMTPFSPEDAYYDFRNVKEGSGRISVLLAAARADAVAPYISALSGRGISVSRLMVDLQALSELGARISGGRGCIFFRIWQSGYDAALSLPEAEPNFFSDSFAASDERGRAERIVSELKTAAEKAPGRSPLQLFLMEDKDPLLKEQLKSRLGGAAVFLGETDLKLNFASAVREVPFAAVAASHASLQPDVLQLNLLRKGIIPRQKTPYLLTMLLVAAIAAMAVLYVAAPLKLEKKRLSQMAVEINSRKEEVRKIEALQKELLAVQAEIDTINGFKKPEPAALNIVKEIASILPKTAWVSRMRITETTADIEGYAASANELLPKLEASSHLRKVEFASPTFRDAKMNADRFVIKMEIEGAKKVEPQPAAPKGEPAKPVKNEKK